MSFALARPVRLNLDSFALAAGLHPDLVYRLVTVGVLNARRDAAGALWFDPDQLAAVGRIQRLRAVFALNYTALGIVIDLLDRIEALEAALRDRSGQAVLSTGGRSWTRAV